jgi:hypothetical protein
MTTPKLAHATKFGRLYQRPETDASLLKPTWDAVTAGYLLPSVTNVIDVLSKPFLQTWYAKRAAEDALQVNTTHPGLMNAKPFEAIKWISNAALRTSNSAAELGDKVHNAVEMLALGQEPEITSEMEGYVESWRKFIEDCNPEFLFLEATGYGIVPVSAKVKKGFAGTADFIARINGKVYIGDYKTGKSIHTEAALQLAALAHTTEIFDEATETMQPTPKIDGGLVVHLTANGYELHLLEDLEQPWEQFKKMRDLWDFQQSNLNSRTPLFLTKGVEL